MTTQTHIDNALADMTPMETHYVLSAALEDANAMQEALDNWISAGHKDIDTYNQLANYNRSSKLLAAQILGHPINSLGPVHTLASLAYHRLSSGDKRADYAMANSELELIAVASPR